MTWKIGANLGTCSDCSRPFAAEEPFMSRIVDTGGLLERRDTCLACWKRLAERDVFYFWKAVFRPTRKKNPFVDDATLINFFTRLEEEDSAIKMNFRYLLALILMRKKLLAFKDIYKEGASEYMVLKDKTEREHRVLNPGMDKETLEQVKTQMLAVLNEDMFRDEDEKTA
jgi:hypothetical protein